MIYLKLFLSFLQVGVFSIGGGYAAIPIIQSQVVDSNHWLSMGEFTNLVTIAEMTPGPVSINSATFVGIRIAGIPGAIVATLGCILPACIIVSVLALQKRKLPAILRRKADRLLHKGRTPFRLGRKRAMRRQERRPPETAAETTAPLHPGWRRRR